MTGQPSFDIDCSEPAITIGELASELFTSRRGASVPTSPASFCVSAAHMDESGIHSAGGLICAVGSSLAMSAAPRDSTWTWTHLPFTIGWVDWYSAAVCRTTSSTAGVTATFSGRAPWQSGPLVASNATTVTLTAATTPISAPTGSTARRKMLEEGWLRDDIP